MAFVVVVVVVVVISDYAQYLKTEKEIRKSLRRGKLYSIEASNEALAMLIGRVLQIPDSSALHILYLATICKQRNQRFHSFFSHYYENRTLQMRPRRCR